MMRTRLPSCTCLRGYCLRHPTLPPPRDTSITVAPLGRWERGDDIELRSVRGPGRLARVWHISDANALIVCYRGSWRYRWLTVERNAGWVAEVLLMLAVLCGIGWWLFG